MAKRNTIYMLAKINGSVKKVLSGSVWELCRGFNGSIGMILEEKIPEIIVYIVIGNAHIH